LGWDYPGILCNNYAFYCVKASIWAFIVAMRS